MGETKSEVIESVELEARDILDAFSRHRFYVSLSLGPDGPRDSHGRIYYTGTPASKMGLDGLLKSGRSLKDALLEMLVELAQLDAGVSEPQSLMVMEFRGWPKARRTAEGVDVELFYRAYGGQITRNQVVASANGGTDARALSEAANINLPHTER